MRPLLTVFAGAFIALFVVSVACAQQDGPAAHGAQDDRVVADPFDASEETQRATDVAADWWAHTVYWENDGSILKRNNGRDRHYTNGSAMSFAHEPEWAHHVADWLEIPGDHGIAAGYTAGQLMFTPEDITRKDVVRDDRPYAGYLYGGVFWQHANPELTMLDHVQVDLGIVGPAALAEPAQSFVHSMVNGIDPRGWDNQLRNEPTFQLTLRRKWRAARGALPVGDGELAWDVLPAVGLGLGTVRREVEGSLMARVGVHLPRDFGPGRIGDVYSVVDAAGTGQGSAAPLGAYLFGQVTGRVVEHNLFIEGNTWTDSHGVEAKELVGSVRLGLALRHVTRHWTFDVTYSQTFLTDQFKGQGTGDGFGALAVNATSTF